MDRQTPHSVTSHLAAVLYALRGEPGLSRDGRARADAAIADFEAQFPGVQPAPPARVAGDGSLVPREVRYLVRLPGYIDADPLLSYLAFWVTAPSESDVYAALPVYTRVSAHNVDAHEPGVRFALPGDIALLEAEVRALLARSAPRDAISDLLDQAAAMIQIMCSETTQPSEAARMARLKFARDLRELRERHRFGRALAENLRRRIISGIEDPTKLEIERIFALVDLPPAGGAEPGL